MCIGLNDKSRMKREFHVRFCESLKGRLLGATRPFPPVSLGVRSQVNMCMHMQGIDPEYCTRCQEVLEREPLPPDSFRLVNGIGVLVLRRLKSGLVKVLTDAGISEISEDVLQSNVVDSCVTSIHASLISIAAKRGFLFVPQRALTTREQLEDKGPTHCYNCKIILSLKVGSLGCTECNYYVCRCGRCLCGYTGRNWKGELFSQFPPLPISRSERVDYVRALMFLTAT